MLYGKVMCSVLTLLIATVTGSPLVSLNTKRQNGFNWRPGSNNDQMRNTRTYIGPADDSWLPWVGLAAREWFRSLDRDLRAGRNIARDGDTRMRRDSTLSYTVMDIYGIDTQIEVDVGIFAMRATGTWQPPNLEVPGLAPAGPFNIPNDVGDMITVQRSPEGEWVGSGANDGSIWMCWYQIRRNPRPEQRQVDQFGYDVFTTNNQENIPTNDSGDIAAWRGSARRPALNDITHQLDQWASNW